MKNRRKVQCLVAAVLVCVLAVTGIKAVPAFASEAEPEIRENVIFEAAFEDADSTFKADGWDEATAWKWFKGDTPWWEYQEYVTKTAYDGKNVLQFCTTKYTYAEARAVKSINRTNLENLTVEFDVISPDGMTVQLGLGSVNQTFGTSNTDHVASVEQAPGDILWEGTPAAWTRVKVVFTFGQGTVKTTAYTKNIADTESEYTAVDGYSDHSVSGTYVAEEVLNVVLHSTLTETNKKVCFDNVKIYDTYTVIPDDQIIYANKSLFTAAFENAGSTLKADGWDEATAWRWFNGYTEPWWEYQEYVTKTTYDGKNVLQFCSTNYGDAKCRAVKSLDRTNLENLTVEFDVISPDGYTVQFGLGSVNPAFGTSNKDHVASVETAPGDILWEGTPAVWTRVKVVFTFGQSTVKTTAYTKNAADAAAEYAAVEGYSDHSVKGSYAAEVLNIVLSSAVDKNKRVCFDNLDMYVTHSYKNGKCTECGDYRDGIAALGGYSLTLEDGLIGLNFYMDMNAATDLTNTEMRFDVNGREQTVTYADAAAKDGYKVFSCWMAAKEMADKVKAVMYNDGVRGTVYEYSVKEYADKILSDETAYAKEIPLVQAMLNYGSSAQTYFEYNTDALANGGKYLGSTELNSVTAQTLGSYGVQNALGNDDVKLYGASLVLEAKTTLRLYVTISDSVDKDTLTCNGQTLTRKGSYYYVDIQDILPQNLTENQTASISYGDGQKVDITYNCMTYGYNVLSRNETKDTLKDVVRALYLYGEAAKAYAKK